MNPTVLFLVASDPRTSARPAEAIRIAAGVGAWKKADLTLYLRGPAVLALGEFADELVDGDNFVRYLPLLREWGRPVFVEAGAPLLTELGESSLPYEPIDDARLAALAVRCDYLIRF